MTTLRVGKLHVRYSTCSSSVSGVSVMGVRHSFCKMDENSSSSGGALSVFRNSANISSLPYRCSASLNWGDGGGDVIPVPPERARSHSGPKFSISDILMFWNLVYSVGIKKGWSYSIEFLWDFKIQYHMGCKATCATNLEVLWLSISTEGGEVYNINRK